MTKTHYANLKIGHATDEPFFTGCTVFLCPPETVASADMRGMAPGSREIALLDPVKSVPFINGVLFTGGSAFGLAAADGVMRYLSERGIGHATPIKPIPLVPTAVVYDLFGSRTVTWGTKPVLQRKKTVHQPRVVLAPGQG